VIIIDVREPDELVNEGVIPGATNIPMGQVESRYLYSELFINDVTQSHILIRPSLTFLCTLKKINDTISLFRFYFAGLLFALL